MKNLLLAISIFVSINIQAAIVYTLGSSGSGSSSVSGTNITSTNALYGSVLTADGIGGVSWVAIGNLLNSANAVAIDDFSQYIPGNLSTLDGGYGWTSDGIITAAHTNIPKTMLDGTTKNVVQMGRGEIIRPIPYGTNWQELRVMWLVALTNHGANFTNSISFGLCSGTNQGFYNAVTPMTWIGFSQDNIADNNIYYSNSLFRPYMVPWLMRGLHKTNNVISGGISGTGSTGHAIGITPHFSVIHLRVRRASYLTNQVMTIDMSMPSREAPPDTSDLAVLDVYPTIPMAVADIEWETTSGIELTMVGFRSMVDINTRERDFAKLNCISLAWGSDSNLLDVAGVIITKIK